MQLWSPPDFLLYLHIDARKSATDMGYKIGRVSNSKFAADHTNLSHKLLHFRHWKNDEISVEMSSQNCLSLTLRRRRITGSPKPVQKSHRSALADLERNQFRQGCTNRVFASRVLLTGALRFPVSTLGLPVTLRFDLSLETIACDLGRILCRGLLAISLASHFER
jgi:hypothetical protein